MLHKIAATLGGGVSVAKAQHPLEGCSRAMNIVSSISRVIPHLSSKGQEQTLAGSHQLVIRVRLFVERLPILCYFYFPTVQKKLKIVEIPPPHHNPIDPF
jgi:hypothetical protein